MIRNLNALGSALLAAALLCLPVAGVAQTTINRAKVNYILQCQGCHKADGSGTHATPDLATNGKAFLSSPEGRDFFISVPGVADAALSDAELADVINYVIATIIIKDGDASSLFYEVAELSKYRQTKIVDDIALKRRAIVGNAR